MDVGSTIASIAAAGASVLAASSGIWVYLERRKSAALDAEKARLTAELEAKKSEGQQDLDHQKQMDAQALALINEHKTERAADRAYFIERMNKLESQHEDCERRYEESERRHNEKDVRLGNLDNQLAMLADRNANLNAKLERYIGMVEQLSKTGCEMGGPCRALAAQAALKADFMRALAPQSQQPTNVTVNVTPEQAEQPPAEPNE